MTTKTETRPAPIVLPVELRGGPSALILAEHSCDVITGGVAALGTIAQLAVSATEQAESTVDIDWCGIEDLIKGIGFELLEGPFGKLTAAIRDAMRKEDAARERAPAGGAR
jgi:hypothetical protein